MISATLQMLDGTGEAPTKSRVAVRSASGHCGESNTHAGGFCNAAVPGQRCQIEQLRLVRLEVARGVPHLDDAVLDGHGAPVGCWMHSNLATAVLKSDVCSKGVR